MVAAPRRSSGRSGGSATFSASMGEQTTVHGEASFDDELKHPGVDQLRLCVSNGRGIESATLSVEFVMFKGRQLERASFQILPEW